MTTPGTNSYATPSIQVRLRLFAPGGWTPGQFTISYLYPGEYTIKAEH